MRRRRSVVPRAKTLYVRDEDSVIWDQAAKAAAEEGVSLSEFVTASVRERVDRRRPLAFEELSAESMEPYTATTAIKRTHKFLGRWILKDVRSAQPGAFQDIWSIAITEDGVFAAHVLRGGETPLLGTDPKLDELARRFLIPDDVVAAAVEALSGVEWVVRRKI
jgi:hypothetical protein